MLKNLLKIPEQQKLLMVFVNDPLLLTETDGSASVRLTNTFFTLPDNEAQLFFYPWEWEDMVIFILKTIS